MTIHYQQLTLSTLEYIYYNVIHSETMWNTIQYNLITKQIYTYKTNTKTS